MLWTWKTDGRFTKGTPLTSKNSLFPVWGQFTAISHVERCPISTSKKVLTLDSIPRNETMGRNHGSKLAIALLMFSSGTNVRAFDWKQRNIWLWSLNETLSQWSITPPSEARDRSDESQSALSRFPVSVSFRGASCGPMLLVSISPPDVAMRFREVRIWSESLLYLDADLFEGQSSEAQDSLTLLSFKRNSHARVNLGAFLVPSDSQIEFSSTMHNISLRA